MRRITRDWLSPGPHDGTIRRTVGVDDKTYQEMRNQLDLLEWVPASVRQEARLASSKYPRTPMSSASTSPEPMDRS